MFRRREDNDVPSGGGKVHDISYGVKISLCLSFAWSLRDTDHADRPIWQKFPIASLWAVVESYPATGLASDRVVGAVFWLLRMTSLDVVKFFCAKKRK